MHSEKVAEVTTIVKAWFDLARSASKHEQQARVFE